MTYGNRGKIAHKEEEKQKSYKIASNLRQLKFASNLDLF